MKYFLTVILAGFYLASYSQKACEPNFMDIYDFSIGDGFNILGSSHEGIDFGGLGAAVKE